MMKSKSHPSVEAASPRPYHHGDLRLALVDATTRLIEERGLEAVSMREVAKMVGVSPGAPFRHFANRLALLTAVAEQAMDRLVIEIDKATGAVERNDPIQLFRAIGVGFLRWAISNPTHFQVISNRSIIDFEASSLRCRNAAIQARMTALMAEAAASHRLSPGDPGRHQIAGRALVYGLARMYVDGQFPSWNLSESEAFTTCEAILDQFIATITV
jgi:AcrR family transcriptional regulator